MLGQGHFFFSLKTMSASIPCVSARCRQGEKQMACAYVVCTVKHGGGVMGLVTLLAIIQGNIYPHDCHSIQQENILPYGLCVIVDFCTFYTCVNAKQGFCS